MSLDEDRVESLLNLKSPANREQLLQIIGSFNYVRRYVPEMAELMSPLCKLLRKDVNFVWLPNHEKALNLLKKKFVLLLLYVHLICITLKWTWVLYVSA